MDCCRPQVKRSIAFDADVYRCVLRQAGLDKVKRLIKPTHASDVKLFTIE